MWRRGKKEGEMVDYEGIEVETQGKKKREMADNEGRKTGWVTEAEKEVGKQRRYVKEHLGLEYEEGY